MSQVIYPHTRLFLVRHGQTAWNVERRIQGHSDIPLNETGFLQARRVAEKFYERAEKITALYSSDLSRASATAREIGAKLGKEIFLTTALRELHYGQAEGLTADEREQQFGARRNFLDSTYPRPARWEHPEWPGGESKKQLLTRVQTCLQEIALKHCDQSVIVVTHSSVIQTLVASVHPEPVMTPNCCVAEFHYDHTQPDHPLIFISVEP